MTRLTWLCRQIPRRPAGTAAAVLVALLPLAAPDPPAAAAQGGTAPAAVSDADIAGAVHVCSSCHGPAGHSVSSTFPRLAGQQKDYLAAQLRAFRDHTRADPHAKTYMWGMAARLSDGLIDGIADYYARQPPVAGEPTSTDAVAGRKLYTEGNPAQSVPPCQGCHGEHAEGNAIIPRLAGQHSDYIERQLAAFASMARANEVMHENSKNLTPEQMHNLAAYLRTQ